MSRCLGENCEIAERRSAQRTPAYVSESTSVDATVVMDLDSNIIAQRLFPLRKWYYANPLWYYHAPAFEHPLRTDQKFFKLVDPALRELCHVLLEAGLCTTPS